MSTPAFPLQTDPAVPPTTPQVPPVDPGTPPPDPAAEQWAIATATGTRYRTIEDAARGIEEKDRVIAQYKQQMDLAQRAFGIGPQPQAVTPQGPNYLDLMEQSIQRNDPSLFQAAIAKDAEAIAERKFQALMAPFQPLMGQTALQTAARTAASGPKGDPNIVAFVEGGGLDRIKALDPELGEVIDIARLNPELYPKLPGLIKSAYRLANAGAPAAPAPPGPRTPTGSSTPATPVPNATSDARRQWLFDQPLEQILG